jgi:CubicO group peptidase (beta-lactamase class C family)
MNSVLPRSTPEALGVPSSAIDAFELALEQLDHVDSYMLLRGGQVIGERWWGSAGPEIAHVMWSISKSFTSTAVGLAISQGLFGLHDRVVDLLPDSAPAEVGPLLGRLTVRHLLTMTTGHAAESLPDPERGGDVDWARHILAHPIDFEPGTHFVYNSGASYLLSAIVQRTSGLLLVDYLLPRLFEPLGVEPPSWELSPQGINTGGWGLELRTEDLAKFGQLYLRRGHLDDSVVVPEEWVAEATSRQVPNGDPTAPSDWSQGYGYQFWQCRNGAYRGDGLGGQFCIVMPKQDAVLVITADLVDMQQELDVLWNHLLPALPVH